MSSDSNAQRTEPQAVAMAAAAQPLPPQPSAGSSLARYDLICILICNDAFLRTARLSTLVKLPQLARQHRDILSLVSADAWIDRLYDQLGLTDSFFEDLDEPVDRRAVLEGLCSFLTRNNGFPSSFEAYQKELPLWWILHHNSDMVPPVWDYLNPIIEASDMPCIACAGPKTLEAVRWLDPQEQFRLVDSAQIIRRHHCPDCAAVIRNWDRRAIYAIVRPDEHPFHTREQWVRLLPHELDILGDPDFYELHLVNCSLSSLSGWPEELEHISHLRIDGEPAADRVEDPTGMRRVSGETEPVSSATCGSSKHFPRCLARLRSLDVSHCTRLASLAELHPLPYLNKLRLPFSVLSLEGLLTQLDALEELDMWECSSLKSLLGLVSMPKLKVLRLPRSGRYLDDMSDWSAWLHHHQQSQPSAEPDEALATPWPSLTELWVQYPPGGLGPLSTMLESIQSLHLFMSGQSNVFATLPPMLRLTSLWLHGSMDTLAQIDGYPDSLQLLCLDQDCMVSSLAGMPEMPKLETLVLPSCISTMIAMAPRLESLVRLNLLACTALRSLEGFPCSPKLEELYLPPSLETLEGMPPTLPAIKSLSLSVCIRLRDLKNVPAMPMLLNLTLPESLRSLQGMPRTLESLTTLGVSRCRRLKSLEGLSNLPSVRRLELPPGLEALSIASVSLDSVVELSVASCLLLKTLGGFPQAPRLELLVPARTLTTLEGLPTVMGCLKRLDLSGCTELACLKGFPHAPRLETLILDKSLGSLQGLPPALPALTLLRFQGATASCANPNLLSDLQHMALPLLRELWLPPSVQNFQGLPGVLESLETLDLSMACASLRSLVGLPHMPRLTMMVLAGQTEPNLVVQELAAAVTAYRPNVEIRWRQ
ncbi:uncharacterized protein BJ171DRAFT_509150 [Polychytrium aggregatum]|uniref:uncharacterized protein n=1 Tax=Polychytrium aggregatum TaxID=110093 RepID=UPI0022FE4125|nr:uncharacterized protein BJ171DRAFT_509150 [Polychytrium aggregatum]KAI9203636.1 hypothetical protein BJ171DRAFT_509150 [Polychytrium aggregatum]